MRANMIAAVLASAALIGGGGVVTAPQASADGQGCDMRIDELSVHGRTWVHAHAWAWCDPTRELPSVHEFRFTLQKLIGGNWTDQLSNPPDGRIPKGMIDYGIDAPCSSGTWRVLAEAIGTMAAGPFDFPQRMGTLDVSGSDCNLSMN